MNKKLISAVLGSLVLAAPVIARAEEPKKEEKAAEGSGEKPAKAEKKHKGKKAAKGSEAAKGGEKSCGGDGKSCGGDKK